MEMVIDDWIACVHGEMLPVLKMFSSSVAT